MILIEVDSAMLKYCYESCMEKQYKGLGQVTNTAWGKAYIYIYIYHIVGKFGEIGESSMIHQMQQFTYS